jgi:prepilin-type N-terminal cleavage/methylation domain-containing protein
MRQTVHQPEQRRNRQQAGFTLLEVIAAMGLIVFLIGGVYGIAEATLRLSTSMSLSRTTQARLTNFTNQWRACLENLPAGTKLTSDPGTGKSGEARLLLENCGTPFAWSRSARAAAAVEFRIVHDKDQSRLMVRHLKRPERAKPDADYVTIAELPLLEGIKSCSWDFYDEPAKTWVTKWDDPARMPLFLRMRWSLDGDPLAHEALFWMANDMPTTAADSAQPAAPATPPPTT